MTMHKNDDDQLDSETMITITADTISNDVNNYELMADIVTKLVMTGSTRYHIPVFHRHVLARLHNFL